MHIDPKVEEARKKASQELRSLHKRLVTNISGVSATARDRLDQLALIVDDALGRIETHFTTADPANSFVFLISGKRYHGKDTVADMIIEELGSTNKYSELDKYPLADKLKDIAIDLLPNVDTDSFHTQEGKEAFNEELGMTNREALIQIGCIIRKLYAGAWCKPVAESIVWEHEHNYSPNKNWAIVVPDIRFPDEVHYITKGVMNTGCRIIKIRVTRPESGKEDLDDISETSMDTYQSFDHVLVNTDLATLENDVKKIVQDLLAPVAETV